MPRTAPTPLIVTRHAGLVEWLRRRGVTGEIVAHVRDINQIRGRVVYGVLPMRLAAYTETFVAVEMPHISYEEQGRALTPEEMDRVGAHLVAYKVQEVQEEVEV